jgi:hypothetical protein
MTRRAATITARPQAPTRALALAVLLALGAPSVRAESKAPDAAPPAPLSLATPALASAAPAGPVDVLAAASDEVRRVARWVVESRDNAGLPFVLIDKVNAQVFAFTAAGQLKGASPALLGLARGDRLLAPNSATMAEMPPSVRITPAGRFVSRLAIDSHGKELLVLDYDASISLHAVIPGTPEERRAERLGSPTAEDNRISFGCINVPTNFYATVVSPTFARTKGIVYVLPETRPAGEVFGFQPAAVPATAATARGGTAVEAQTARLVPASSAK